MTTKEQVLRYLENFGATADAKLAGAFGVRHQQVNQACRQLEREGLILRGPGPSGVIENSLKRVGVSTVNNDTLQLAPPAPSQPNTDLLGEDALKRGVVAYLRSLGFTVDVRWGRERGIDIEAHDGKVRLVLEAKGEATNPPQQVNYFLGAIGELVQRMTDPVAVYGLALPDNRQYRGLVSRLPSLVRQSIVHVVLFVDATSGRVELDGSLARTA